MAHRGPARIWRAAAGPPGRVVALGAVLCAAGASTGRPAVQILGAVFLVWCVAVAALLRKADAQGLQDP